MEVLSEKEERVKAVVKRHGDKIAPMLAAGLMLTVLMAAQARCPSKMITVGESATIIR